MRDGRRHLPESRAIGVDLGEEKLDKHPELRKMNARENLQI